MIHSLSGKLKEVGLNFIVVDAGGVGYKVYIPLGQNKLPEKGKTVQVYTHLQLRDGGMDLYGFFGEDELGLFESLISVSGVGPKSAMAILSVASANKIAGAIASGEPELLQRSSGIGRKTAERIMVELKDKIAPADAGEAARLVESDQDVFEALLGLGYQRRKIDDVLREINPEITDVRERLKEALKLIRD